MQECEIYELILAVNIGAYLEKRRQKQYYSVFDANDKFIKEHLNHFYEFVNSYVKLFKLESIKYLESDPILRKEKNTCSAHDVALLSIECLKIPLFKQILKKISHESKIKYINSEGHLMERVEVIHNKAILNKFIAYSNVCRNWE